MYKRVNYGIYGTRYPVKVWDIRYKISGLWHGVHLAPMLKLALVVSLKKNTGGLSIGDWATIWLVGRTGTRVVAVSYGLYIVMAPE